MKPLFLFRLILDCVAASLLLVALAYDWLGNIAHEVIGTALFALLINHNIFNRRWYGALTRGWRRPGAIYSKVVTLALLVLMLGLLVTSIVVSRTLFSALPIPNPFIVRQLHALFAYLVIFIAGLHLGLQWSIVMRATRNALGIQTESRLRRYSLRLVAAMIAIYGLYSMTVIDIMSKLMMQVSLSFWDFETAALAFFLHIGAIVGLSAFVSHYMLKLLGALKLPH